MQDAKLLTVEEVCELFAISRITAYRWISKGKLISIKVGKRHLIDSKDIDKLIQKKRVSNERKNPSEK